MKVRYFKNGKFYSLDEFGDTFSYAICIDGKVSYTSDEPIPVGRFKKMKRVEFSEIDLGNAPVIPSFCDAHIHLLFSANRLSTADFSSVRSYSDFIAKVKDEYEKKMQLNRGRGEVLLGGGWDCNNWSDRKSPPVKREALAGLEEMPVVLYSKDYHTVLLNDAAIRKFDCEKPLPGLLASLSVTDETYAADCDKGEDGALTGLFRENAMRYVAAAYKQKVIATEETVMAQIRDFTGLCNAHGITAVSDCSSIWDESSFRFYQKLSHDSLSLRNCVSVPDDALEKFISLGLCTGMGNEFFRIGGLKILYDGSLGSMTGYMRDPYEGSKETGKKNYDSSRLEQIAFRALDNGIGLTVHAIGDRACEETIGLFEKARNRNAKIPLRIEHAQTLTDDSIERMKKLNIHPVMQPVHIDQDIAGARRNLGSRAKLLYRFRSLQNAGIFPAFSTDLPVAPLNPFLGIYSAVTHKGYDFAKGETLNEKESLGLFDALRAYTLFAHLYSQFPEAGLLREGYSADMAVLSKDPFSIKDPEELLDIVVTSTFLKGESVYATRHI